MIMIGIMVQLHLYSADESGIDGLTVHNGCSVVSTASGATIETEIHEFCHQPNFGDLYDVGDENLVGNLMFGYS